MKIVISSFYSVWVYALPAIVIYHRLFSEYFQENARTHAPERFDKPTHHLAFVDLFSNGTTYNLIWEINLMWNEHRLQILFVDVIKLKKKEKQQRKNGKWRLSITFKADRWL